MIAAIAKPAVMILKITTPRHSGVMMSVAAGMAADHARGPVTTSWPDIDTPRTQRDTPATGARHTEHGGATHRARGRSEDAAAVHLAEWVGDQFDPGSVWVPEIDGR